MSLKSIRVPGSICLVSNMVNKRLEELLEFAQSTDLQEVVWEKKGALISFRRSVVSEPHGKNPASASVPSAGLSAATAGTTIEPGPMTIRSTMVGTFYRSDSPNRPPLVVEGTVVTSGQSVAAIEAMKIMKDVVAPSACKIVKALVANGHPVEYGQPLFEVEPQAEEPANV
jgi:acetyl-CoA carboxylase biotin carboxyl carrier protein